MMRCAPLFFGAKNTPTAPVGLRSDREVNHPPAVELAQEFCIGPRIADQPLLTVRPPCLLYTSPSPRDRSLS
eukprot:1656252-Pyramimonas_sp.AAC.1